MPKQRQQANGFTLVEIMVVIAIIGLLAAIVVPNVVRHFDEARLETARVEVSQINDAIKTFYVREHRVPTLQDLVDPPPELEGFTEIPTDPWQRPYLLRQRDERRSWEVVSLGPDGEDGTEDDISSARRRR